MSDTPAILSITDAAAFLRKPESWLSDNIGAKQTADAKGSKTPPPVGPVFVGFEDFLDWRDSQDGVSRPRLKAVPQSQIQVSK